MSISYFTHLSLLLYKGVNFSNNTYKINKKFLLDDLHSIMISSNQPERSLLCYGYHNYYIDSGYPNYILFAIVCSFNNCFKRSYKFQIISISIHYVTQIIFRLVKTPKTPETNNCTYLNKNLDKSHSIIQFYAIVQTFIPSWESNPRSGRRAHCVTEVVERN